ncbi:unnamed protein product [Camellia sinensis]
MGKYRIPLPLSENQLTGPIPSYAVWISKLIYIGLQNNSLNGTIPSWLFVQHSLSSIDLSNNMLQGPIPRSVYELQNLTYLRLSSNNFSGVIKLDKLLKLKYLYYLDPSYNGLSLNINNSVNSTLRYFKTIGLASCNLSEFSNFLRVLHDLIALDLSNNKIHGEVPKWIFDVGKNTWDSLDLSHNFLTSLECLPLKNLEYINLHSNLFRGPLPLPPISTIVFSISNNKLTGEIPQLICSLIALEVLDLSNNSLSGVIPQCLGNISINLSVLSLWMNSFRGIFTAAFTKGNMLRSLNLNDNQIEGDVPRSLLNCRHLEELQVLVLSFNRFHGHMDTSKTKSKHHFRMRIIDISCNEFTGLLPTNYIKQFGAMMNVDEHEMKLKYMGQTYHQDSVLVVIKGYEIKLSRILTVFSIIDFSRNNFHGDIPKSIGGLK